ncbi:hypothetical protein Tco_1132087 [Tanacetum coccineum]|uniref:Reverse transcriptase domain-containing protein n=1 Tax=Tanacetum coccineum TaxID=301880 RepID=A0ABQ5JBJ9_9ASTR
MIVLGVTACTSNHMMQIRAGDDSHIWKGLCLSEGIVGHDATYVMTWTELKKKMDDKELALLCVRMFPEEYDKVERYVGGLPDMIHGSVVASKPKTIQEATKMATELMDKKICTFAERQAANKRKFEDTSRKQPNQYKQPSKRKKWGKGIRCTAPHLG